MNAMIILFVIFVVSSIWAILKSRKQGPRSRRRGYFSDYENDSE